MLYWSDYFEDAKIIGLDLDEVIFDYKNEKLVTYQGSQTDLELIDKIRSKEAPNKFDIIIDDCSHIAELTKISFWHLFNNHLKDDGLYVIEDWGCGYWSKWPDGHRYSKQKSNFFRKIFNKIINLSLHNISSTNMQKKINWLSHHFRKKKFKSHNYGMVGFIKELVDECGAADISSKNSGSEKSVNSKFKFYKIYPGVVFIKKSIT